MEHPNHIPDVRPLSDVGLIFHTDNISCCRDGRCGDDMVLVLHMAATDVLSQYQQAANNLVQTATTVRTWHHKDSRVGLQVQQWRHLSSNLSASRDRWGWVLQISQGRDICPSFTQLTGGSTRWRDRGALISAGTFSPWFIARPLSPSSPPTSHLGIRPSLSSSNPNSPLIFHLCSPSF